MKTNIKIYSRLIATSILLTTGIASFAQTGTAGGTDQVTATGDQSIRPFKAEIPEAAIADMRKRIVETRWPAKETVADQSQGMKLEKLQELASYWATDYDWRKAEAKLNAYPQFITNIDGLDIHFIHVRSKNPNAMPMIMTHGWPGSIFELLKVIGPLTDPVAYGGKAEDAFDLVIPSIPGFGFSGKPTATGWDSDHIGHAWAELMARLGYTKYVSQGGDCGSVISQRMAKNHEKGLIGIHVNMPATVPPEIAKALTDGDKAPAGLSAKELEAFKTLDIFYRKSTGYSGMMVTRPQTIGYSLADSPVGQAAWMYDEFAGWTFSGGDPEKSLTKDEMLDDISLYWLTNTGASSARIYWEDHSNNFNAVNLTLPVAVTVFPGEIYKAPKTWANRAYHNLIYFNEVNKGGHFAAWEEPQLFSEEIRKAFKSLRPLVK
ncbi:epoxide hydrolase [Mucilaginibacter sp. BJC16-A38]|uniref:epoxide hydrolase family protein n=1 Tax=Mucilaginibacter phenanthrenivorans TaxID=1234842 RepID=UPI0021580D69|nr:epoxide hydrolase family protein [Mucilaginibacter phenanthrenivorans]MCR8557310.1 epoxide hydrolase [Mucilaginibacter phenanthrenivorans]